MNFTRSIGIAILFVMSQLVTNSLSAQTLEILSASGTEVQNLTHQIDYTVGELVIETGVANESVITQGYHQSKLEVVGIGEIPSEFDISIYPNPTRGLITIESPNLSEIESIQLFDFKGSLLETSRIFEVDRLDIDLNSYSNGTFLLKAITKENKSQLNFKILKTN